MRQDTTSALAGLASFTKLQDLLAARKQLPLNSRRNGATSETHRWVALDAP